MNAILKQIWHDYSTFPSNIISFDVDYLTHTQAQFCSLFFRSLSADVKFPTKMKQGKQ